MYVDLVQICHEINYILSLKPFLKILVSVKVMRFLIHVFFKNEETVPSSVYFIQQLGNKQRIWRFYDLNIMCHVSEHFQKG